MSLPSVQLTLYHYWRSSSSWRVRWALELKGIRPHFQSVNLLSDEAESPAHLARNPMGFVPVLEVQDDGQSHFLAESTAILEWLEEKFPSPALLPQDGYLRAHSRMLNEIINAGIQPMQNPTVTEYFSEDPEKRKLWTQHFIRRGFTALETLLKAHAGAFCIGDELSLTDLYLIPQCYAAQRNDIDLSEFPTIAKVHANAIQTPSSIASHPDRYKPS
jgi:maleylpyruvate isomerase